MNGKLWNALALGLLVISNAGYAAENGGPPVWNLVQDIGASSNQISFNQGANGVWFFMKSNTLDQEESSYSLLTEYFAPCFQTDIEGLLCWAPCSPWLYECGHPFFGFNATADTQYPGTPIWPARTFCMHPAAYELAIVAWRSPIRGRIDITGSFTDFDAFRGNGVLWFINKGEETLDSGVVENGGDATFHLRRVRIRPGEVVYFIVDPRDYDHGFDTTGFDVTIQRSASE